MSLSGAGAPQVVQRGQVSAGTAGYEPCQQRFRSFRFVLYGARELAAGIGEPFGRHRWRYRSTHPGQSGHAPMASKTSRNLVSYHKSSAFLLSPRRRQGRGMEMPARSAGLDPIVAEIIEAHARTMVDNDNNKQRRATARRVQGRLPLWQIRKDEGL